MSSHVSSVKTRVAVLMATYNGVFYVSSQIASILWQLDVQVDLYIRDDGSTDETLSMLHESFPQRRLFVIKEPNSPTSFLERGAALNFFRLIASDQIVASNYDWIALSDQDDIWFPSKLSSAINDCFRTGSVAWSSSILAFWEKSGKALYIPKHGKVSKINSLLESPGPGCTFLFRSEVFQSLQSFVRHHLNTLKKVEFHDWFIYAFVMHKYGSWFISRLPSMLYRQHGLNVAGAGMSISQVQKKLSLVYSGWYREQVLLISSLLSTDKHPIVLRLKRFSLWDRLCLPLVLWPYRRKFQDKLVIALILPFSGVRKVIKRQY